MGQISSGKIDELIAQTYKGDHEKMKVAINNVAEVLQSLQKELARLTEAANAGKLARARASRSVPRRFAEIVRGVNAVLDAVITPLNVSARYVDLISQGRASRRRSPTLTTATSISSRTISIPSSWP